MSARDLSSERAHALTAQNEIAAAAPSFAVIACPGAGKTHLIVDRHMNRPVPARKGRAIISFTRVAAVEIHQRCAAQHRLDLADHPHFIGTLDTFIWLHLVRPFLPTDRSWQRLDSWREAPAKYRELRCGPRTVFRLEDVQFEPSVDGTWSLALRGYAARSSAEAMAGWQQVAHAAHDALVELGYLTGAELRNCARYFLQQQGPRIAELLAAKYDELIVDEAQDCSVVDLHILRTLHNLGVPLILVADPDQEIYGFRGGATAELGALSNHLGTREIIRNWRSTNTICRLAATLRSSARPADVAVADHHSEATPILLYDAAERDAAVRDFLTHAAKLGIGVESCMILAHARSTLPKKHAGPAEPPTGGTASFIWAVGILNEFPTAPSKTRDLARDVLARTVLRWWYTTADISTAAAMLTAHDLDAADFARLLHRIRTAMPPLDQTLASWLTDAKKILNNHPPAPEITRTGATFRTPRNAPSTARAVAGLPPPATDVLGKPRFSTVHQVKGDQADAVLLCMPKSGTATSTIKEWLTDREPGTPVSEALRVLYVAVTRARRLVGLTVPTQHHDQIARYLNAREIPTESRQKRLTIVSSAVVGRRSRGRQ